MAHSNTVIMNKILNSIINKYNRTLSYQLFRNLVRIKTKIPLISFSFDDAPKTAFTNGGSILSADGVKGTYFISIGKLDLESPSGVIGSKSDLLQASDIGHELGCHTFDHIDPWNSSVQIFEDSVRKNQKALEHFLPCATFRTFAYPFRPPRPAIKNRIGDIFDCCRGGGQTFNAGKVDLNLAKGFFLDRRTGESIDSVKRIIDRNCELNGWLIFATHDISRDPSPYGCTENFFRVILKSALDSGALILPVGEACLKITTSATSESNHKLDEKKNQDN
jgi:hypothetical protein